MVDYIYTGPGFRLVKIYMLAIKMGNFRTVHKMEEILNSISNLKTFYCPEIFLWAKLRCSAISIKSKIRMFSQTNQAFPETQESYCSPDIFMKKKQIFLHKYSLGTYIHKAWKPFETVAGAQHSIYLEFTSYSTKFVLED